MDEIITKDGKHPLKKSKGERTLLDDVEAEVNNKYDLVKKIVHRLMRDTYTEEILDEKGNLISTKTHIHPQLLKWLREARMFCGDIWKMSGGEVQQEGQKKALELKARLIMNSIGDNPDEYKEKLEEWKKNRTFKE